ncbi:aldehyde dehydrogenase (NADP(+)) [Phycisphaerales bacterium AB-hyl4]|uniref:Aldehyde dehydrogenase (NADP(+)) n=1 Tax=Natronomicrosphaera hydrolytica TaxID=3242702 RepID=A0ABV4UBH0_9BACT
MPQTSLTGRHLIDGTWQADATATFQAIDAQQGEALPQPFTEATAADVGRAVHAATTAMHQLADRDPRCAAQALDAIANALNEHAEAIYDAAACETALPRPRLEGEMARTVNQLRMFARFVEAGDHLDPVIDVGDPHRSPAPKPDLRRVNVPIGPVVVFGASNFPLAFGVVGGDTASALAAGNAAIVKGHPAHPATNERVASAVYQGLEAAGCPAGLFALLQGQSPKLSECLVQHPAVAAVGFTGSKRVGRRLHDLAAARPRPIPVFAEMASVNPVLVLPKALERAEQLAPALADAVALGSGQFCTKPGLIFTVGDGEPLARAIASQLQTKGPLQMLGTRFRDDFLAATRQHAALPGIQSLLQPIADQTSACTASLLLTDVHTLLQHPALYEEVFGPHAIVVTCPDLHASLQAIDQLDGQLTTTVRAGDGEAPVHIHQVLQRLAGVCGRIVYNGVPTGVEVCHAMVHGGPYPATTAAASTSVGTLAARRFLRPLAYQNVPDAHLPPALKNANPLGLLRRVDGLPTHKPVEFTA